jgi:hypothetical protein
MSDSVLEPRAVTRDLFSAAIGSVLCCYVGQPFDTIKVRMQTSPDQFSHVVGSTNQILRNEVCELLLLGISEKEGCLYTKLMLHVHLRKDGVFVGYDNNRKINII